MCTWKNVCVQGCFNQKTWRQQWGLQKCPSHWDVLEWSLQTAPSPSFPLYLFIFTLSLSFTHSGFTVKLCNESLLYAAQGPAWVPSLGSQTKQWRWCYLNAARSLSAWIGPGWPSGRLVDACPCQAPIGFPPWTSAVCGKAVEFVCGCILILHLFSSSHAWPNKPPALLTVLVLIALAWLAVCFWLHSLISIPLEATIVAACGHAQTCTHSHVFFLSGRRGFNFDLQPEKRGRAWSTLSPLDSSLNSVSFIVLSSNHPDVKVNLAFHS